MARVFKRCSMAQWWTTVVGHSGAFSGPQSINQNQSNMYNEVTMITKNGNKFQARTFFYVFGTNREFFKVVSLFSDVDTFECF